MLRQPLLSSLTKKNINSFRRAVAFSPKLPESCWEDIRQRSEIKSAEFYESNSKLRQYFYHVNLNGYIFLEDTRPKNITTCLKSLKFIDFFISRIRPNATGEHSDYPFVSPCGYEMNFIKAADPNGSVVLSSWDPETGNFTFGASGVQPIKPDSFVYSSNGRLYHALTTHPHSKDLGHVALIRSQIALEMCEKNIVFGDGDRIEGSTFHWGGTPFEIRTHLEF
jgi:hypothetical protein